MHKYTAEFAPSLEDMDTKEVTEADQAAFAGQMEGIQHWEPVIAGRRYPPPLLISEAPPSLHRLKRMPSRVDRPQLSLPRRV